MGLRLSSMGIISFKGGIRLGSKSKREITNTKVYLSDILMEYKKRKQYLIIIINK
jgi:hypothetical protein